MTNIMTRNGLILAGFALCTTALISVTYMGTKDAIAAQQQAQTMKMLEQILIDGSYNNDIHQDCMSVVDEDYFGTPEPVTVYRARYDEVPSGVVLETVAPDGYSGNIYLLVGMDLSSNVTGVRIVDHKETPGLGDKIELSVSDWILSFNNKSYTAKTQSKWAVVKDGGEFDAFTGATITPRAVVSAVAKTADYVNQHGDTLFLADNTCATDLIGSKTSDQDTTL